VNWNKRNYSILASLKIKLLELKRPVGLYKRSNTPYCQKEKKRRVGMKTYSKK
jgi:hypothetical protein